MVKFIILLLIIINLINSNESIMLKKDDRLYDLIGLLNSASNTFSDWGNIAITNENIMKFFNIFDPWLLIPIIFKEDNNNNDNNNNMMNNFDNKNIDHNNDNDLNCKNTRYSNVFTGSLLKKPRILIDFIPFGYDIDKLFIRFNESYNIIDIYVIYECPYTLIGNLTY